jgi:hypothetical protein
MSRIDAKIEKKLEEIEQLKNQKKSQQRREQKAKRKMDTRRHIIIGELVCKYFPNMMNYWPQRNRADTADEFAVFENILCMLAANAELVSKLEDEAVKMIAEDQ